MKSESSDENAARKKPLVAAQTRDPPNAFSLLGLDGSAQMRNTLVDGIFDRKRKTPSDVVTK